jgi:hypothetical protein
VHLKFKLMPETLYLTVNIIGASAVARASRLRGAVLGARAGAWPKRARRLYTHTHTR